MEYYLERLRLELIRILDFWLKNMISSDSKWIYPEISVKNEPNQNAPLGSIYLSRIIYGASAACNYLQTLKYKSLADVAFKMLYEQFKNPAGGFYWAKTPSNKIVHDSSNVNMAQAFIIYGLSEYAKLTDNPIVESEIEKLHLFLLNTIKDKDNGGFVDGFTSDWKQEKTFTKSLGTHLHLLEAFVNKYSLTRDNALIDQINELIDIITEHFIDKSTLECYHQLNIHWVPLPNINWAGHNFEVSWILHKSALSINNKNKAQLTGQLAVDMTRRSLEYAFDKDYGGVFNALVDNKPENYEKEWWPQAEAAIACLNAYQISGDKYFLSYGLRLIEYIENTISDNESGEWFSSFKREGQPVLDVPKTHFWKSIYHNARYCIEAGQRMSKITSHYLTRN